MPWAIAVPALTALWGLATRWQFISGIFAGNFFSLFKKKETALDKVTMPNILALAALLIAAAYFLKYLKKMF